MNGTLYFRQGTTNNKDGKMYHNVTALAHLLGRKYCVNLPSFHALTGSDFTYSFLEDQNIKHLKE